MLLKDYLTNILKQYDLNCENFNKFYIGLYNFHRQLFGLVISQF